jgi:hypothetical protein
MNTDDDRNRALDPAFDALRAGMAPLAAPRGVEKELMAAFSQQFAPRRWYRALTKTQWSLAGGVAGTAAVALLALSLSLHAPSAPVDGTAAEAADRGPFIALASAERIEQETDPLMLETDVPRAELASLGVPISPENAGDSVRAELLVGADGSPLALRLIALQ